jgi:hypothetical protein
MGTNSYSFISIFDFLSEYNGEIIKLEKIIIPIIQRDYAQGRLVPEIERIRNRFLDALYNAVVKSPITLDFVYGDIDSSGIMTPLDGQQRLTTLFLLHWYAAKRDNIDFNKSEFLSRFSYETRYSARDFCSQLIRFKPSFQSGTSISNEIINQYWFPLSWVKDQTVSSMLVMIDSIHSKFNDVENLWDKLEAKAISFYFLPIKDMGLTDELYIKMNSRGKPLTQFEHFKAELERKIRDIDIEIEKRISSKIDKEWTELLWDYRGSDNIIDDEFLRYYRFICDMICYKKGDTPQGKSNDEFDLLNKYFNELKSLTENIQVFESYFDCWVSLKEKLPKQFFKKFKQEDILSDCLRNYADISGSKQTKFPLNKKIILYAIVLFLINRNSISDEQYVRRIRIINNLINNSVDEISDSISRVGGNRMPAILKQVDSIMLRDTIDLSFEINFNRFQLEEEKAKLEWTIKNPDKTGILFELEDHPLLYGQISIIGLDQYHLFPRFKLLFKCDYDAIDCALLAIGDYSQTNRWRRQFGSPMAESWKSLFHKSANGRYENTQTVLRELLEKNESFSNAFLYEIADEYKKDCETNNKYDWRYYYIKYSVFRPKKYGKYSWSNYTDKPYEVAVMSTSNKWSSNTYQPFLKEIDEKRLNRDDFGLSLIYDDKYYVKCQNSTYVVQEINSSKILAEINIQQDENGIDIEDRIIKGKNLIFSTIQTLKNGLAS